MSATDDLHSPTIVPGNEDNVFQQEDEEGAYKESACLEYGDIGHLTLVVHPAQTIEEQLEAWFLETIAKLAGLDDASVNKATPHWANQDSAARRKLAERKIIEVEFVKWIIDWRNKDREALFDLFDHLVAAEKANVEASGVIYSAEEGVRPLLGVDSEHVRSVCADNVAFPAPHHKVTSMTANGRMFFYNRFRKTRIANKFFRYSGRTSRVRGRMTCHLQGHSSLLTKGRHLAMAPNITPKDILDALSSTQYCYLLEFLLCAGIDSPQCVCLVGDQLSSPAAYDATEARNIAEVSGQAPVFGGNILAGGSFAQPTFCSRCPHLKFANVDELCHHRAAEHPTVYTCSGCEEVFSNGSQRDYHHRIHQKTFSCTSCPETFTSSQEHRHHYINIHKKEWPCGRCDQVFRDGSSYVLHTLTHCQVFECTKCNEKLSSHAEYLRHNRWVHKRLFDCKMCNHSFDSQTEYNRHYDENHRTERRCGDCGDTFATSTEYSAHRDKHHKEGFECLKCIPKLVFPSRQAYNKHYNQVHRNKAKAADAKRLQRAKRKNAPGGASPEPKKVKAL